MRSCWERRASCDSRSMRMRLCTRCRSGMPSWPDRLPRCSAVSLQPSRCSAVAWRELVNACEALSGGPPMYSLVARVKEILQSVNRTALQSVNRTAWFAVGLPRDDSTDTGYLRGCSPKELIHGQDAERWRAACAAKACRKANAAILRARSLVRSSLPGVLSAS